MNFDIAISRVDYIYLLIYNDIQDIIELISEAMLLVTSYGLF